MKRRLTTIVLFLFMCISIIPMVTIEAEAAVGDKCQYCGHKPLLADPYDEYGKCEKCKKDYDYKSSKKSVSGMFVTNKDVQPSSTPYAATKVNFTISKGEIVTVVASYTNAKKNVWYEVKYSNNKTGYIYEENIDKVAKEADIYTYSTPITIRVKSAKYNNNLKLKSAPSSAGRSLANSYAADWTFSVTKLVKDTSGTCWYYAYPTNFENEPGWLKCSSDWNFTVNSLQKETTSIFKRTPVPSSISNTERELDGSIQTSGQKIYRVSVAIYNGTSTSGTPVMGGKWYTVNATSCNLKGSNPSKDLAFENLTPGKQYTLKISVEIVACKYFDNNNGIKDYIYTLESLPYTFTVSCSHSYSSSYTKDASNHWKVCAICGQSGTKSGHSFTTDHNDSQHWEKCSTCGYTKAKVSHSFSTKKDGNYHWQECSCGYTKSKTSHSFSAKSDGNYHWQECSSCGYTKSKASHSFSTQKDGNYHWQECSSCGYTKSKTNHSFTTKKDGNYHWQECSCGYAKSKASHTMSSGYDYDGSYHWKECTSCNYAASKTSHTLTTERNDSQHWQKCSCGYSTQKTAHSLTNQYNTNNHWKVCSCGYAMSKTSHSFSAKNDINYHWQECSCGYAKSKESHSRSSDYSYDDSNHWKKCTSCSYIVSKFSHSLTTVRDDNQHWQKCFCGYTTQKTAHSLTDKYDTNSHWQECSCGHTTLATNHSFSTQNNSKSHWQECSCGYTTSVTSHSFLTKNDSIYHWQECSSCGYTKSKSSHSSTTDRNESQHWQKCSCGYTTQKTAHNLTNKYDTNSHWQECLCGYSTAKVAHTSGTTATCTTAQTCTVCGADLAKALGHDYSAEWTVDVTPTCTTVGSKSYHCTRCDDKADITEIPANGHTWGDWYEVNVPTCTATGTDERECSVCHAKETKITDALGHTNAAPVVENKVDATCTADGSYDSVIYCSVCKAKVNCEAKVINKLGHDYRNEWTVDVAPTCTTVGSKSYHCTRCDDKADITEIPANGHSWGDWYETKVSTCTATGTDERECSVCHAKETRTTDALDHTNAVPVVENKVDATCTADGSYDSVIYCSVCKVEISRAANVIDKLGHDYSIEWTIDITPSCITIGSKSHHCTRCDEKIDITEIPATGHIGAVPVIENSVEATCTTNGYYDSVVYCSSCNEELSREKKAIPMKNHVDVVDTAVAPTCTETGLTEGAKCSVCGEITKAQEVVAALGHAEETVASKAATCTESGLTEGKKCSVCEEILVAQSEIAEIDHNYGDWIITKQATATENGIRAKTCSACQDLITELIPAIGEETTAPDVEDVISSEEEETLDEEKEGLSGGAIAAIATGSTVAVGGGGFSLFWFVIKKRRFADLFRAAR